MNPGDIDLDGLLKRLHLPTIRRLYADCAARAAPQGWSHRDFLALLIAEEVAYRNDTRIQRAASKAHFPFIKTIENFDFIFQSSLKRQKLGPYLGGELVSEARRRAESLSRSVVVKASVPPRPASIRARLTHLLTALGVSPNSAATLAADLPGCSHRRTTSARYSSVKSRRFFGDLVDMSLPRILPHRFCP